VGARTLSSYKHNQRKQAHAPHRLRPFGGRVRGWINELLLVLNIMHAALQADRLPSRIKTWGSWRHLELPRPSTA
jgi:hypothetical protein